jgi:hypothetical protein
MKKVYIIFILFFILSGCRSSRSFTTESWIITNSYNVEADYIQSGSMLNEEMFCEEGELWQVVNTYSAEFELEQGSRYKIKFDAWADKKVVLNMDIFKSDPDDYISYVKGYVTNFLLTDNRQNFQFEFTMDSPTDEKALLSFLITNNVNVILNIGNIELEKIEEKEAEKPLVSVMEFRNLEESNYLTAVCESLTNIMTFTLNSIGQYNYFENEGWLPEDEMKEYASNNNIDNIIFGNAFLDEEGKIQVEAFVYDNSQKNVTISESGTAENIFEAFDVAEALVKRLFEGFSNIHIAYGTIKINNRGSLDYKTTVYLDNKPIGDNIYEIGNVFIGEHNIRIVQHAETNYYVLYSGTIPVNEDRISEIEINVEYIDEVYNGIKVDLGPPGQEVVEGWTEWVSYNSPPIVDDLVWKRNPGNNHCYASVKHEESDKNIYDDVKYAVSLYSHLATINNLEENVWLAEYMQEGRIGYTDIDNEGHWYWLSGQISNFERWAPDEPNGGLLENSADLSKTRGNGLWSDEAAFDNFIIEWSPDYERPLNAFYDFSFTVKINSPVSPLTFDVENPVFRDCVISESDELVLVVMGLERGYYSMDLLLSNYGNTNSVFDILVEDSRHRKPEAVIEGESINVTDEDKFKIFSVELKTSNFFYSVVTVKRISGDLYLNGIRISRLH